MFAPLPELFDGDVLTEVVWDQLAGDLNRGVMRPVASTLLASPAATITFSDIPSSWLHLCVMVTARSSNASTNVGLTVRLNGDASAVYDSQHFSAANTTATAAESLLTTGLTMAGIPAASGSANRFSSVELWVPGYASTDREKVMIATTSRFYDDTAANFATQEGGGWWRSTAAVSSVVLSLSAGNFVAGSRATLYALGS